MIEVKNVQKKFKKQISKKEEIEFYAVNDISFKADSGKIRNVSRRITS